MERILEKLLDPAVVWVLIPLVAIVFWGVSSVMRAHRGGSRESEELEQTKAELKALRVRVEALENGQVRGERAIDERSLGIRAAK